MLYLEQGVSISTLVSSYGVSKTTIKSWIRKYQDSGVDGLKESRTWINYSSDLKEQAVRDYLEGRGSQRQIVQDYQISSSSVLNSWIKRHTSGKPLTATSKGLRRMKQGRKTTFEEGVEMVNFTIAHDKNYQAAIAKYNVSYQQVYSWVREFEKDGSQGLLDRHGKGLEGKPNLTPEEELQLKVKQLEERHRYLEMEVGLLRSSLWPIVASLKLLTLGGAIRKRLKSQRLAPKVGRNQTSKPTVRLGRHLETFQAIKDYVDGNDQVSISQLCRFLKVSRSGYYKWIKHEEAASETTNQALMATITELHAKYKGILGYRRMTRFVNRQLGTNYNKKRIRRLMHILGLSSVIRRSRAYCTKTSFVNVEANLLNREFTADAPNQKWCTDVTFLHYGLGSKAYLSTIKALYDGSIVAYHISRHKDNLLVMENLRQAMAANPGARPLLHSDRDSQYISKEYRLVTS